MKIILHPDGQREERELPTESDKRLEALQAAVGGYMGSHEDRNRNSR